MTHNDLIQQLASGFLDEMIRFRRHFHRNPELSGKEEKTAAYICSILDEWELPYQSGIGGHGIVALIHGDKPGNCVALRADMDALPIQEENKHSFKSLNDGVMHACGHDAHMAALLGAAFILRNMTSHFSGTIKLIFQPSEEMFPGGAIKMIHDGALTNPDVHVIIGQHVLPQLPSGIIGLKSGQYMASTDEIYITVHGRGGHGATPELNIDPVIIGAQIITSLQQVVSRNANPATPTVLSFGRFIADGRTNIIPDNARIEGTLRTFDEKWRAEAHLLIEKIAISVAGAFGATCKVDIHKGYPFLINHPHFTDTARIAAENLLGKDAVVELPLRMTAEDFSYYAHRVPGVYYRLGIAASEATSFTNLHTATFDIDETALQTGASVMVAMALKILAEINEEIK